MAWLFGKKNHSILKLTLAGTLAILFFQNCQNQHHVSRTIASIKSAAAAPFAEDKVQIHKTPLTENRKQKLIAIVDNECVLESGAGVVTSQLQIEQKLHDTLTTQSYSWSLPQATDLQTIANAANEDPCLIGVSNDDLVQISGLNDPALPQQKNFAAIGGPDTYDFFADPLHGATAPVIVAVVDSGTNINHPDLIHHLWQSGSGANGYNFYLNNTSIADDYGHGTAVASLIAAEANNGMGMVGVQGHNIQIMTLKVINSSGQAYLSDIVEAIDYARANGAHVINLSLEANGANAALLSSLNAAIANNIVVVAAAGNSGAEVNSSQFVIPGAYGSLAGMLTVGSTDVLTGQKSSFSNYSTTLVELSAPGSGGVLVADLSGGTTTNQGTSFSAPQVAGAAALTISFFKKNAIPYTAGGIETVLLSSSPTKTSLQSYFKGGKTLSLAQLKLYLEKNYLHPFDGGFDEE